MASPANYDIRYYQGDSYPFLIRPKSNSGVPYDLTGYTATFDIANKRGSGPTFQVRLVPEIDTIENSILCTIPPATGATLSNDVTYVYDVTITSGTQVYTLLTGTITVTDSVQGA